MLHVEWSAVTREMLLPRLALNHDTITIVVAVFGTTISPYLFFWQAAQEMEDLRSLRCGPHDRQCNAAA